MKSTLDLETAIFKKGSTTYYWSSRFFPTGVRDDVFRFYSFVRVVDDCVDSVPADSARFSTLNRAWQQANRQTSFDTTPRPDDTIDQRVIKNIVFIVRRYHCDPAWIESFFASMQADLDKKRYRTLDDTLWYIYGSAEVIGLVMSKILALPPEAAHAAQMQGRAMQFINFLRDIAEDNALGRCYFPEADLKKFGLKDLTQATATQQPEAFKDFMHFELERYQQWQAEAYQGYHFIPRRLRIPLATATDMYNWTAQQLAANPTVVFSHKVKPPKRLVLQTALAKSLS